MRYIKYLSEESAHRFIHTKSLRYTPLNDFNDPFEGGIIIGSTHDNNIEDYQIDIDLRNHNVVFKEYLEEVENLKNRINIDNVLKQICGSSGIACLCLSKSEKADDPLMWAHYSRDHKGIAVAFDPAHPYFKEVDEVHYTEKRLVLNEKILLDNKQGLPINTFFAKDKCWSYEREVRLSKQQSQLKSIANNDSTIFTDCIPTEAIKEIYIGCRAGTKLKDLIVDFCKLQAINYHFLEMKKDTYGLTINLSERRVKRVIDFEQMCEMMKYN